MVLWYAKIAWNWQALNRELSERSSMLKAITFDFWGTLYQNAYAHEERRCLLWTTLLQHDQPRSLDEIDKAYHHAREVWDRVWRAEQRSLSIGRWLQEMLVSLNADLPDDVKVKLGRTIQEVYLLLDEPQPVPGAVDAVAHLSQNYSLGLISDTGLTPGRVLRKVMERDGLLHHFEALTFSDEIGSAKPQPEPFLRTLVALDVQPEAALHIGDLPETDLAGARDVGMKTLLFLGVSERDDGRSLADGVFESYDELSELLERLT